ncbi:MAG TPA: phosphoribosylformylglycinamidine synthase subunit PurS [Solirubrobacterales bacterium]|nr:phosphoribosylformylglycinamidine synthase subunit PurS [Solirubrobacterales bacterium]
MIARVLIKPKDGILDPQGKAVERALPTLGVGSVSDVRVGRMVELHYEDRAELESLCERLLVNPLIEDYEIEEMTPTESSASRPVPSDEAS